jgi:hypothetical protein
MALPSSGPISFSAIYIEFTNGGCLDIGEFSLSAFAAAIGYINLDGIATSAFYGGECTQPLICNCYNLVLDAFSTDYYYIDCCHIEVAGTTTQGFTACIDSGKNPPYASQGYWIQLGPCGCGDVCGK